MSFAARLGEVVAATGSLLCVGLDPDLDDAPDAASAERLCRHLIEATLPSTAAYKPNTAFFEQHGSAGWAVLERLRAALPEDRLLVVDAKRGDIGSTAAAYARALFDGLGADAVTVNPLMGEDAVRPFLERPDRGAFILTRTSNPGAADLLEQPLADGTPVHARIAELIARWDTAQNVGAVVGATAPEAIAAVRERLPRAPLLVPGVGAQGGSLADAVQAGLDADGGGLLISVSRGISRAPEGPAAAAAAYRAGIAAVRGR